MTDHVQNESGHGDIQIARGSFGQYQKSSIIS